MSLDVVDAVSPESSPEIFDRQSGISAKPYSEAREWPTLRARAVRPEWRHHMPIFAQAALRLGDFAVILLPGLAVALTNPVAGSFSSFEVIVVLLAFAAAYGALLRSKAYDPTKGVRWKPSIWDWIAPWLSALGLILGAAAVLDIEDRIGRAAILEFSGWSTVCFLIVRFSMYRYIVKLADSGAFALRTVVVGAGQDGQQFLEYLDRQRVPLINVVGFVDDRKRRIKSGPGGLPLLGGTDTLIPMIRDGQVDLVVLALRSSAEERIEEISGRLAATAVDIRLAPDSSAVRWAKGRVSYLADMPLLHLSDRPMSGWNGIAKKIEDFAIASFAAILAAPLILLLALAIKIDSPGPILFKQRRFGFNGKVFVVYKFRTMHHSFCDERQATRNDPRVTRVGAFLRRTSLDELPQLLNVFLGQMSIVGPRPHSIGTRMDGREFEEIVERYAARHRIKPGITGWAQVNGFRGETDTVEKLQYRVDHDLYYVENWSVYFDILIIMRTFTIVLGGKNAY